MFLAHLRLDVVQEIVLSTIFSLICEFQRLISSIMS